MVALLAQVPEWELEGVQELELGLGGQEGA